MKYEQLHIIQNAILIPIFTEHSFFHEVRFYR